MHDMAKVKDLISEGKSEKAVEVLLKMNLSTNEYDRIVDFSGRLKELKRGYNEGVIREDDFRIEMNRIRKGLLEAVRELGRIENNNEVKSEKQENGKNEKWVYSNSWTYVLLALFLIGLNVNSYYKNKEQEGIENSDEQNSLSVQDRDQNELPKQVLINIGDSSTVEESSIENEMGNNYFDYSIGMNGKNIQFVDSLMRLKLYDEILEILYFLEADKRHVLRRKSISRHITGIIVAKEKRLDHIYPMFPGDFILGEKDSLFGLIMEDGNLFTDFVYEEIDPSFIEDFYITMNNQKFGFIFPKYGVNIEPQFNDIYPEFDNCILVSIDEKSGLLNYKGELIHKVIYDQIWPPNMGLLRVKLDDKWGFIDTLGRITVPIVYDFLENFENGLAYAVKGKNRMFININGEIVEKMK